MERDMKDKLREPFLTDTQDKEICLSSEDHMNKHKIGYWYNVCSLIAFFVLNCGLKYQYVFNPDIGVNTSLFQKSIFQVIISVIYIYHSHGRLIMGENWKEVNGLCWNAVFAHLICTFFILANLYMRLGSSYAILYTYPFLTAILAAFFLKERYRALDVIAIFVGFACICLITKLGVTEQPFESSNLNYNATTTLLGILFAFLSSISLALKQVISKFLSFKSDINVINLYIALGGLLFTLPVMIYNQERFVLNFSSVIFSIILGAASFYGNYFLIRSFEYISLIDTLSINFLSIFFSFVFGAFAMHNSFDIFDIIGSLTLILFNIYYAKKKIQYEEDEKQHLHTERFRSK
jgi:drug/metabolite transporter (DMT)-like permease